MSSRSHDATFHYRPEGRSSLPESLRTTPVTTALIAVNIVFFALEAAWGGVDDAETMYRMGAIATFEDVPFFVGSLVAYGFLHFGGLHIAMNMLALSSLGRTLEPSLGSARYFVLYGTSLVGGGAAIRLFSTGSLTAGASGAIFGLAGAVTVFLGLAYRRSRIREERDAIRQRIGWLILPNVAISLIPGVSLAGHAGGFFVGAAVFLVLLVERVRTQSRAPGPGASATATLLALGVAAAITSVWAQTTPWAGG